MNPKPRHGCAGQGFRVRTLIPAAAAQGKAAYFQWREDLKKFHAATVTKAMREEGYPDESCAKVGRGGTCVWGGVMGDRGCVRR